MTGIRAAIHRYIKGPPFNRSTNILGDKFTSANTMFQAKCQKYVADGNPKPKHKDSITDEDMKLLGQYFVNKNMCPIKLQQYIWFMLCYHFGKRGREKWRELKSGFYIVNTEGGQQCIREAATENTKNHQGGNKQTDQDYSDNKIYDPQVIESFKLYEEKICKDNQIFFQSPDSTCHVNESRWYKADPIGKNTLCDMMKTISRKAGLSQSYTCHCIRASTITRLFQAGVSAKDICSLTKHKNEMSLNPYIGGLSKKQKTHMEGILTDAFQVAFHIQHVVKKCKMKNYQIYVKRNIM